MAVSSPAVLPAVPPSVAEWEDLLVRMEIMPRVLRNTLEEVPPEDPRAAALVEELVGRESRVSGWLEGVAGGGMEAAPVPIAPRAGGAAAQADRFASLRARNFAMLQRRGLEVWRWTAEFAGEGDVTAFQVVSWLVAQDVRLLAALRERAPGRSGAC